jgi:hypothetical protein
LKTVKETRGKVTPTEIMDKIADGMILRVTSDAVELVEFERRRYPTGKPEREPIPVTQGDLQQALTTGDPVKYGMFAKLTKDGSPPPWERKKLVGYRMGWEEMGLDGDKADYYLLCQ